MKMIRTKFVTVSVMLLALLGSGVARAETGVTDLVDGVTSNVTGNANVGNTGPFNTLIVTNGGQLFVTSVGYIGNGTGASNNTAIVTGSGSVWSNNNFAVGFSGAANQFIIRNGGVATNGVAFIGYNSGPPATPSSFPEVHGTTTATSNSVPAAPATS